MCWEHKAIIMITGLNMYAIRNPLKMSFKWRKVDWRDFNSKAALYLETTFPEDRNISNDEVEELTRSLSKDINRAMERLLPKGIVGT